MPARRSSASVRCSASPNPGVSRDGGEVAVRVGGARLLGEQAVGEQRQRAAAGEDARQLAEPQRELARREDVHVEMRPVALGEPAAQVGAQQRAADEHDHGPQRIAGLQRRGCGRAAQASRAASSPVTIRAGGAAAAVLPVRGLR